MKSLVFWLLCFLFLLQLQEGSVNAASEVWTDDDISDRIVGGEKTEAHRWLWLVALIDVETAKFFCGGSLISAYHVLSAAHCFHEKNSYDVRDKDTVNAYLGKHNLSDIFEPGFETSSISEIYMHPDWKFNDDKYDADIAVILLLRKIEFSDKIKPVALPPKITDDDDEVEVIGIVVGWGLTDPDDEDEDVEIPSEIEIPAINGTFCFESDYDLAVIASPRSFCAGFQNKSISACTGDSGGGFYVRNAETGKFDMRGIVSAGLAIGEGACDANKFTLYTVVGKFVDWIKGKMEETEKIEANIVQYRCEEIEWDHNFLDCYPDDDDDSEIKTNFRGQFNIDPKHYFNSTSEARGLLMWCYEQNDQCIRPIGFGKSFPNLERLAIMDITHIRREYFVGLENLTRLRIDPKRIKHLSENFLWDLRDLELLIMGIEHQRSALRLPDNIFSKSKKLKKIDLVRLRLLSLNKKHLQGLDDLRSLHFRIRDTLSLDENLFANHRQLEELSIVVNEGVFLPKQLLSPLVRLKMLKLRFDKDLNQEFNFLPSLSHMKLLRYLRLKTPSRLNSDFFCGLLLEILSLYRSHINDLPDGYFEHLKTLKILNLSYCKISTVSKDAFKSLELLIGLDLSYNEIKSLPERVFEPLNCLKVLRLVKNPLKTLDAGMFDVNRKIEVTSNCGQVRLRKFSKYDIDKNTHFCGFKIEKTNGSIDFISSAPVGTVLIAGVGIYEDNVELNERKWKSNA